MQLQLAVAIAIIRHKPPGTSGRKHAENLKAKLWPVRRGDNYGQGQETGHPRVHGKTGFHDEADIRGQENSDTVCDSQETVMPEYLYTNKPMGHTNTDECTGHTNTDKCMKTTDKESSAVHCKCDKIVSPPSTFHDRNDSNPSNSKSHVNRPCYASLADHEPEMYELENARFLQSLSWLASLECSQSLSKEETVRGCVGHVDAIASILARDILTLPEACLCQAASVVVTIFDSGPWLHEYDDFIRAVSGLIGVVLWQLETAPDSRTDWRVLDRKKQAMSDILLIFMKSESALLTTTILDSLLEAWQEFCDGLRSSRTSGCPLDPHSFDNSFYVINCLQQIAKQWLTSGHLDGFFLQETQERLNKSVMNLTSAFPLLCHAVWRVTACIEKIFQDGA